MAPLRQASPAQRRRVATLRRDGALNRLTSITGSIAIATIAAVAALGVYVAKALPGHHTGSSTGTTTTVPAGNTGQGAGASSSSNSLNPPPTSPAPASAPPPVTSGST